MNLLRATLLALLATVAPAAADDAPVCPIPEGVALQDLALPATRAAIAAKHLGILVLGGAASAGGAANGATFTVEARLQAQLTRRLPGVGITVVTRAVAHRTAEVTLRELPADLASVRPALVIWGAGGTEAAAGTDIDAFTAELEDGAARIRAAGADLILIDLQYAPSIVRVLNLAPYRDAVLRVARANDIPVLDRYELMRSWSDGGVVNLDATAPAERLTVTRRLFHCLAAALADGIAPP